MVCMSTTTHASVNLATAISCPVCLIPHDDETHAATLRAHAALLLPEMQTARTRRRAGTFWSGEAVVQCVDCGSDFATTELSGAIRCPSCRVVHNRTAARDYNRNKRAEARMK